jgi:putative nucleotidyltransferase with HDIG domain
MKGGLEAAREALGERQAWLVGGAVRDRLLGRETADLDLVVAGDPGEAAKAVARAAGSAACFALSEDFGCWRIVARDRSWQVDVEPLRAETLEEDLALRDFTVNAIAEPLAGGDAVDPLGGELDLRAGRLRMAGPSAFREDPLRVLRLVRVAVELGLEPDDEALRAATREAAALDGVSGERVFVELRRIVASDRAREGLELLSRLGAGAVVLPELEALRGVGQNRYHHLDVLGHTLEVLEQTIALEAGTGPSEAVLAPYRQEVDALLSEPLADDMTRGEALRWGALLHDAAKPLTRKTMVGFGPTFIGHDERGAELAREVLGRLRASERLRAHVAALARHHLRLGFLVHESQPLARRTTFAYLSACSPVEVDVTLLSIADRLATRGKRADEAIAAHLAVAGAVLADALSWRADGTPQPLWRGDELARELGMTPGPKLGALLGELQAARYAGEISDRDEALSHARRALRTI